MTKKLIPRKHERKRIVGEVLVRPLNQQAPQPGQVFDLGESGLAMFVGHSLAAGQDVEIAFRVVQPAAQAGLEKRVGRVVRNRTHPDGNVVGIAFAQPLQSDELKNLQAHWVRS